MPMTAMMVKSEFAARILICEDEEIIAEDMVASLRSLGYEVVGVVSTGHEAVQAAEESQPDLILMDVKLRGEIQGITAFQRIRSSQDVPVIYITDYDSPDNVERAKTTGPYGYLSKPVSIHELKGNVEIALYKHQVDKQLRESEERLAEIISSSPAVIYTAEAAGDYPAKFISDNVTAMVGYEPEEFLADPAFWASHIHPEDSSRVFAEMSSLFEHGRHVHEYRFRHKDESYRWMRDEINLIRDENGTAVEIMGYWIDITVRKQAEDALRKSEAKFRRLYETMNDAWVSVDMTGRIQDMNQAYCAMLGYSQEELRKLTYLHLTPEKWHESEARIVENQILIDGFSDVYEKEYRRSDGTVFPVELRTFLVRDETGEPESMWAIVRDITERKLARERTQQSLREKEALIREIHHRVKNNLSVVSSLLGFQGRHARDEYHRNMFIESQDRIRSMALAHEKLYQGENLSTISSKDYLTSLVDLLHSALKKIGSNVQLHLQIAEVDLDLESGVTLGFIVTELVSNAFKHAFPNHRAGQICLSVKEIDHSTLELSVADDGVGLPNDVQLNKPTTLGLDLVRIFSSQLNGHLEFRGDRGTEIILRFSRKR
jgi:PAS domain S-box-containing protein